MKKKGKRDNNTMHFGFALLSCLTKIFSYFFTISLYFSKLLFCPGIKKEMIFNVFQEVAKFSKTLFCAWIPSSKIFLADPDPKKSMRIRNTPNKSDGT